VELLENGPVAGKEVRDATTHGHEIVRAVVSVLELKDELLAGVDGSA
jgi:hypothetical protein